MLECRAFKEWIFNTIEAVHKGKIRNAIRYTCSVILNQTKPKEKNKVRTYPTSEELLTRRVEAINKVNAYAKRLQDQIVEILTPYKGKKIVKSSGSYPELIKKITMPEKENGFRYWFRISEYRVDVELDTTYITNGEKDECHSAAYVKQSVHICTLTDGTELKEMTDGKYTNALREDFTFIEVWNARKQIAELKDQIGILESSIYQFKNSDF